MDDDKTRCCGDCALCVHTYIGSECGLTDKMKEKAFNNSVQAEIEAAKLRELYDRLDDEVTPYEMEVKRVAKGIRLVTISCDESNKDYFSTLLYGYKS